VSAPQSGTQIPMYKRAKTRAFCHLGEPPKGLEAAI
jgi:hypothetical protein